MYRTNARMACAYAAIVDGHGVVRTMPCRLLLVYALLPSSYLQCVSMMVRVCLCVCACVYMHACRAYVSNLLHGVTIHSM